MAHINFLEEERFGFGQFNLKNFELNYLWMSVILGVFLILMLSFGLLQRYRVLGMNEELAAAVAELKKTSSIQPVKPGVSQAPMLLDALLQRVAWSPILNAIANITPDTIFLNYIKGSTMVNRGVQIEGVGADVLATVRYEEQLSTIPFFSKVFLKSSTDRSAEESGGPVPAKSDTKSDTKTEAQPTIVRRNSSRLVFEMQVWLK